MKKLLLIIFNIFAFLYPIPYTLYPIYAQDVGPAGVKQLEEMIIRIINISVSLGFLAMTAFLVWGGIKYLTSGGEQKSLSAAHQTVTWALLGIVFLVIAAVILKLIEELTGVKIYSQFTLCTLFPGGKCP
ncbi:hypothetical protein HYS93_01145 [Candidatus Daviesbacteria bacterium]|nr:hypothetical protein [Candidatus Daviesbacteria bacterium]